MGAICKSASDAKLLLCRENWPPNAFGGKCDVKRHKRATFVESDPDILTVQSRQSAERDPAASARMIANAARRDLCQRTVVCFNFYQDTTPDMVKADWVDAVDDAFMMGRLIGVVFKSKVMADDLVKNGRAWLNTVIRGDHRKDREELKPDCCERCHSPFHAVQQCDAPAPACSFCTGPHDVVQCTKDPALRKCIRCGGPHSAQYLGCPILQAFLREARKNSKEAAALARQQLHRDAPQERPVVSDAQFPPLPINPALSQPARPAATAWHPSVDPNLTTLLGQVTVALKAIEQLAASLSDAVQRLNNVERQLAAAPEARTSQAGDADDVENFTDAVLGLGSTRIRDLVKQIGQEIFTGANKHAASSRITVSRLSSTSSIESDD